MTVKSRIRRIVSAAAMMTAILVALALACPCSAADSVPVCRSSEEASAALREAMTNREEMKAVCLITDVNASDSENLINDIFEGALEHTGNPTEGDYLRFQYDTCSASAKPVSAGGDDAVLFTYAISYYDTADQETAVDEKIAEIIDSLDLADKTEYDKITAIYNYICGNVEYDFDNLEDDDYHLKHTAYGALIDGKAVCQGYSAALYRLLLEAGIDNRVIFGTGSGITGDSENHTWNIVKVNGRYYNTDITADAAGVIRNSFLRGSAAFDDDHVRSEEYMTEPFISEYTVSESDYAADLFMDHLESLAAGIRAMAESVNGLLRW